MRELVIDSRVINDDSDCYVIAEIGHNHQGEVQKAKELFLAAKECGADAVKLQKRDNRTLFTTDMYNKPYEHRNSFGRTYGEHRENLEFGWDEYRELQDYAAELGIAFFSTAFDIPSADFLARLDVPAIKVASGDLHNVPLLRHLAKLGKPLIVSTGGGTLADVQRAYQVIAPYHTPVAFLQCTAIYPAEAQDMNLRTIATFRETFPDLVVGLSDHYNGIAMAVVAYVLGARIIEKHFTLNHTWKGSDHAMSLEPIGMSKMVRDLHRARSAMGDGVKRVLPSEHDALFKMSKALYAAHDLPAGHVLTAADVAVKSPGDGILPYEFDSLVGRRLRKPIATEQKFTWDDVE